MAKATPLYGVCPIIIPENTNAINCLSLIQTYTTCSFCHFPEVLQRMDIFQSQNPFFFGHGLQMGDNRLTHIVRTRDILD